MKNSAALILFVLIFVSGIFARTIENFDIVSYTAPAGWQKTGNADVLFFTTEDKAKNVYCAITLFRAFPSKGDSKTNFNAAWSSLVADSFKLLSAPQMGAPASDNGWSIESGVAAFEKDGAKGLLMLFTASGGGKMINVLVLTNTDAYQNQVSSFVESVKLPPVTAHQNADQQTFPPSSPVSGGANGITKSTRNFPDGWTATVQPDYVSVTRGNYRVYLIYQMPFTSEARQMGIGAYYWKNYAQALFNVAPQPSKRDDTLGIDFVEGNGADKQSGRPVYVAMSVLSQDGTAKVVIAAASDRQSYYNQFPRPENLGGMVQYNEFAITQADLIGEWDGKNAPTVQLYSIYTGNAAALNMSTFDENFVFSGNGTYVNEHSGSSGTGGRQSYSAVRLNGRFIVSDWEMTLTNRENGKTSNYAASFEAVKGGKILHMRDKQYTSAQFHLFKVK